MALLLNTNDKCQMGITTTQYLPTPLMANERLTPTEREVKWGKYICTGDENWNNQLSRYDSDEKSMFSLNLFTQAALSTLAKTTHFRWYTASQQISAPTGTFAQNPSEATKNYFYFNISNSILGVTKDSTLAEKQDAMKKWVKSKYDAGTPVTVYYLLQNPTTEPVTTNPIGTLRNEEKTIKGITTIITTDTEVLPTQIETSYKSNKADYVVVNFATTDGNVFTTANGDTYTIKMRKSQYDTMMTNELLNLLEVM